jgi:hypothetical protein
MGLDKNLPTVGTCAFTLEEIHHLVFVKSRNNGVLQNGGNVGGYARMGTFSKATPPKLTPPCSPPSLPYGGVLQLGASRLRLSSLQPPSIRKANLVFHQTPSHNQFHRPFFLPDINSSSRIPHHCFRRAVKMVSRMTTASRRLTQCHFDLT